MGLVLEANDNEGENLARRTHLKGLYRENRG